MTSSISLFVGQQDRRTPPKLSSVAHYQVVVCPSHPLVIGTLVRLIRMLDPPELVPFFPSHNRNSFAAYHLGICGPLVAIRSQDRQVIEFVVQNLDDKAPIQKAFIQVPLIPGLTARLDTWASVAANLELRLQLVSAAMLSTLRNRQSQTPDMPNRTQKKPSWTTNFGNNHTVV